MPKDFTKKQFSRTLRGYAPDDVDSYISSINGEFAKLEKHSAESDRRLVFALRKLESLTKELQSIYSSVENTQSEPEQTEEKSVPENSDAALLSDAKAELKRVTDELEAKKAELESAKVEAEKLRAASEERARTLLSAARSRGDAIILEAQEKSDAIIAQSAKKARAAAEQIITDAAIASRKIIRDAENKADDACRDLTAIYTAAERMYKEVSEFRGDVFSLYSNHISSLESISGSADTMLSSVTKIVEQLESGEAPDTMLTDGGENQDNTPADGESAPLVFAEDTQTTDESEAEVEPEAEPEEVHVTISKPEPVNDDGEDEDEDDLPKNDLYITVGDDEEEEYYDSFDSIPEEEDEPFDEADEPAAETDGNEEDEEDRSLPWDDEPLEDEPVEEAESGESDEDEPLENEPDEYDLEYDEAEKALREDDDCDDFTLSDDASGNTNVLDIVKKMNGGAKKTDDFDGIVSALAADGVSEDEFRRAFSDMREKSDIDEIMRQPDAPRASSPTSGKHKKF